MTTKTFDLTDYGELYMIAAHAKAAGFPRVEIDPADAMAMYEEIKRLRGLLQPFADLADLIDNGARIGLRDYLPADYPLYSLDKEAVLTVGQVRACRQAVG